MSKTIALASLGMLLFPLGQSQNARFTKYSAVETYEVRPGILALPSYANDGQVCQIEIEKRHYSEGTVSLDPSLPHEELQMIVDELVPPVERGPRIVDFGTEYMSVQTGNAVTTFAQYKNISIDIYSKVSPALDVAAIIRWSNRRCH